LLAKNIQNDKNYAILKKVQPKFSPDWDEINGKIISTWNLGTILLDQYAVRHEFPIGG